MNEYISINSPSNIYNFFYNKYNLTKPFDTYITFSQFEIILEAENDLYVSSYSMTYKRNKPEELKYNGDDRPTSKDNCTNGQVCIEHYGCINNKCQKCQDIACEKCSGSTSHCDKCYAIAENWNGLGTENNCKILNFIDLAKFSMNEKNIIIENVPPAYHYRVTMEFWIYVNYPKLMNNTFMNIIFKDFMAISIQKLNDNSLEVFCVPIEFLYNFPEDETFYEKKTNNNIKEIIDDELGAFYVKKSFENIATKWINIRCAYNIENSKMIINEDEYVMKIPQFYVGQTNIPFYLKKFYKENQFTKIIFQRFFNQETFIYLRNLNIFREFIPYSIVTKYLNLHELNSDEFPQLLFSIPFDKVELISGKTYKFKTYNYLDIPNVDVNNTHKLTTKEDNLQPPRNFHRLNLLSPNNSQYSSCDLDELKEIDCLAGEKCFDDNLAYVCEVNNDYPFYLDPINLKCQRGCPYNYMIYPRDNDYKQRQICNKACDSNTYQCASSDNNYFNISEGFICGTGFFNLYYKCYDIQDSINDVDNVGIYFGEILNSHSIEIDLKKTYNYFAISMWIFPAFHLPNYRYDKENHNKRFDFSDWNGRYIFMSNDLYITYNNESTYQYVSGSIRIIGKFQLYNWNHLLITVEKENSGQMLYASFTNQWFEYYYYDFFGISTSGKTLSFLYFCNNDNIPSKCSNIKWIEAFYRKIQIFDITYSNKFSMLYLTQFENENNYMLKHMFINRMESIINNKIYDEFNNSIYGIVSILEKETKKHHNPDNTNYFNYESNYFPDRAFNNNSNYIYNYKIEKLVAKLNCSYNSICEYATTGGRCLTCKKEYSLWGKENNCYEQSVLSFYTYKNPGLNQPNKLYLNINYESFKNSPSLTLFFFIKLYSFRNDINKKEEYKKILIFDEENNFYLGYDPQKQESLYFNYKDTIIFQYTNFRNGNFGFWIPISIAAFRESDRTFQLNMLSASIKNSNLDYKLDASEFYKVDFKDFIITNNWVGLLSDIKIYDRFMVNAWGIIRNKNIQSDFPPIFALSLKSSSVTNCFSQDLLLHSPGSSYEHRCVMDYSIYLDSCSITNSNQYLDEYFGLGGYSNCSGTCGDSYGPLMCLGNLYVESSNDNVDNKSCDSKKFLFSNYYLRLISNKIRCISNENINYARFKSVNLTVKSPTLEWNLEFWFFTDSYRNIIAENNFKKNNFDNIVLEWDYHNKIILKSIHVSANRYNLSIT